MTAKVRKRSLVASIGVLCLCVVALIGATFAWFTDTASTNVNKIQAGTLNVALMQSKDGGSTWTSAEGQTLDWVKAAGASENEAVLWEPGCTYQLPQLKIVNVGDLALKYTLKVTGVTGSAELLEAIDFSISYDGADKVALADKTDVLLEANSQTVPFVISGHMQENAGNEYQGLSISGIAITVYATQVEHEYDSFNNTYDENAFSQMPTSVPAVSVGELDVNKDSGTGTVTTAGEQTKTVGDMTVTFPNGVKLATGDTDANKSNVENVDVQEGQTSGKADVKEGFEYKNDQGSSAISGIELGDDCVHYFELDLPIASDNTVLVKVEKQYNIGVTVKNVYHDGTAMTKLDTAALPASPAANTEYYNYDSTTGKMTLWVFHASPIDVVYEQPVAKIAQTNTFFNSLGAAIAAAEDGQTVGLLDDITSGPIAVPAEKAITLEGNGHTVTISGRALFDNGGLDGITLDGIGKNANFTVKNLRMTSSCNQFALITSVDPREQGAATVIFDGCTFKDMYAAVYGNSMKSGDSVDLTIENCTYENCTYGLSLEKDSGWTVSFSDNTMTGETAIQELFSAASYITSPTVKVFSGTYSKDPSAFVAEGCTVTNDKAKNVWTVDSQFEKKGNVLYYDGTPFTGKYAAEQKLYKDGIEYTTDEYLEFLLDEDVLTDGGETPGKAVLAAGNGSSVKVNNVGPNGESVWLRIIHIDGNQIKVIAALRTDGNHFDCDEVTDCDGKVYWGNDDNDNSNVYEYSCVDKACIGFYNMLQKDFQSAIVKDHIRCGTYDWYDTETPEGFTGEFEFKTKIGVANWCYEDYDYVSSVTLDRYVYCLGLDEFYEYYGSGKNTFTWDDIKAVWSFGKPSWIRDNINYAHYTGSGTVTGKTIYLTNEYQTIAPDAVEGYNWVYPVFTLDIATLAYNNFE